MYIADIVLLFITSPSVDLSCRSTLSNMVSCTKLFLVHCVVNKRISQSVIHSFRIYLPMLNVLYVFQSKKNIHVGNKIDLV